MRALFRLATGPAWGRRRWSSPDPTSPSAIRGCQRQAAQNGSPGGQPATIPAARRVGAEAGYDSNVFYGETNVKGSAIVRVVPFVELTNQTRMGAVPSGASFDIGAALAYREYLSNDPLIREQRAFMPTGYGDPEFGGARVRALAGRLKPSPEPRTCLTSLTARTWAITRDQCGFGLFAGRWMPGGGRPLARFARRTSSTSSRPTICGQPIRCSTCCRWTWPGSGYPRPPWSADREGYTSYLNSVPGANRSRLRIPFMRWPAFAA